MPRIASACVAKSACTGAGGNPPPSIVNGRTTRPLPHPATEANATSNAALRRCETDCIKLSRILTRGRGRGEEDFRREVVKTTIHVQDRGFPRTPRRHIARSSPGLLSTPRTPGRPRADGVPARRAIIGERTNEQGRDLGGGLVRAATAGGARQPHTLRGGRRRRSHRAAPRQPD